MQGDSDGSGRTALITGASAGIGAALARVFAEHGFDLVLVARREAKLVHLATELATRYGVRAQTLVQDLAESAAPRRIFDEVSARGIVIDALVNNAGYGVPGTFRETTWSEHADFLQVMLGGVLELTHLFEPGMSERGYGRILQVASLAGLVPSSAKHTLYGATKAFLIRFSEALSAEHQGDNVHVTALCPGFTYSEFHDVLGNREKMKRLPRFLWMDADTVARQGFDAVMRGDSVYVNGSVNRAIAVLGRVLPASAARAMMRIPARQFRVDKNPT